MLALTQRHMLPRFFAAAVLVIAASMALRYLYIDNDGVRTFCDGDPRNWICTLRSKMSLILRHPAVGWGILALTLAAIVRPFAWLAGAACLALAAGLVLYQADLASGAAALLLLGFVIRLPAR
ncbi:MAG TPA: hypothetical protein PKW21_14575 [Rhabdaerophilum sp.]|nr:hypothetical protein [Rhabdaerophilum sp.]